MISVTYRPPDIERHSDGRASRDGRGVGAKDVGERGPVHARQLWVDNTLRVLETHAEEDVTVPGLVAAGAPVAGERVDLKLERSVGQHLEGVTGGGGVRGPTIKRVQNKSS